MSIPEIRGNVHAGDEQIGGKALNVRGPRGYSAYQIAVQNGFNGTVFEWLESLRGEDLRDMGLRVVDGVLCMEWEEDDE